MRVLLNPRWCTALRSIRKATTQDDSLYALLEVDSTASSTQIKHAFRQKAKLYHPDVKQPQEDPSHFARILVAYQVLSNDRQRQLYDLSLKTDSRTVRSAAEQENSSQSLRTGQDDSEEWVPGDGWFAWATRHPATPNPNQLDKLRAELRTEFNAAVRHAYLGPRLQVGAGELPEAFEGEERSVPGMGDVMQLVSGRQLLGVVRERQDLRLPGTNINLGHDVYRHVDSGATNSNHGSDHSLHAETAQSCETESATQKQTTNAAPAFTASQPAPIILELVLEDKPVAVAVRQKLPISAGQHAAASNPFASDTSWDHSMREQAAAQATRNNQAAARPPEAASSNSAAWTHIYSMEGAQLAAEHEGSIYNGGFPGPHTHTLLKGQTPLVRHMHIVTNASGGQELSICRCRRAWLPPATTWLFPPRSQDHASGGWYFEWSGHGFHRHPAWLHPAVFVLLAGLETLHHESLVTAGAKTGQRVQPKAVKQEKLSKAQEAKQWFSSMLRFHNKQG